MNELMKQVGSGRMGCGLVNVHVHLAIIDYNDNNVCTIYIFIHNMYKTHNDTIKKHIELMWFYLKHHFTIQPTLVAHTHPNWRNNQLDKGSETKLQPMRWLSVFDVLENSSLIHVQHWFGLINSDTPVKCEWATFAFTLSTPQRIVERWISICRWHFHWMAEFNNLLKTIIGILCQCLWCFNARQTHTHTHTADAKEVWIWLKAIEVVCKSFA